MSSDPVLDPHDPASGPVELRGPHRPGHSGGVRAGEARRRGAAPAGPRAARRPPGPHDAPARIDKAPLDLARRIVELAEDKKAADIVLLEIAPLTTVADYLVICSGGSERQLGAIADGIAEGLKAEAIRILCARGRGRFALDPARRRVGGRPRLRSARARLLRAGTALGRGEDDPAGPVARSAARAVRGTTAAARRYQRPIAPAARAAACDDPGQAADRYRHRPCAIERSSWIPGTMSSLRDRCPECDTAPGRLAVRRHLPPARPQRAPLLRDSRRAVRGLPPALHRSRPDRAARPGRRPLRLRDRERPGPPGAGLVRAPTDGPASSPRPRRCPAAPVEPTPGRPARRARARTRGAGAGRPRALALERGIQLQQSLERAVQLVRPPARRPAPTASSAGNSSA